MIKKTKKTKRFLFVASVLCGCAYVGWTAKSHEHDLNRLAGTRISVRVPGDNGTR